MIKAAAADSTLPVFRVSPMKTRILLAAQVLLLGSLAPVRADDLEMKLTIKADKTSKEVASENAGLGMRPKPRGRFEAPAGKPLAVNYTVTSTAAKDTAKDVMVHFFVVKIDKVGQTTIPSLNK